MVMFNPPRIFTRDPAPSRWNPDHLAGPYEPLSLREWEQSVISCSLAESVRKLLLACWADFANAHCRRFQAEMGHWQPWVDGAFSAQTPLADFRSFLRSEIAAIWYLLDTPFLPCTGMARDMLLVEHGQYLRELLGALTRTPGACPAHVEVEQALLQLKGRRPAGGAACGNPVSALSASPRAARPGYGPWQAQQRSGIIRWLI